MSDGSRQVQPHRGTLILVFGILGLVLCLIFGIVAWVMGNSDLAAMERGEMDRAGEGMTKTGKILGIVAVALAVLGALVAVAVLVVAGGAATVTR